MSDTPRTDALLKTADDSDVFVELSRQLERELAGAQKKPDYHDGLIEECALVCEQLIEGEEDHGRLQARSILTRCATAIRAIAFSAPAGENHG